jgi:hypothetical protein
MGKMIWRKGKAGERALRRSLTRTYHDVVRAPKSVKDSMLQSYLKNKTDEQKEFIEKVGYEVAESTKEQRRRASAEALHLLTQTETVSNSAERIWKKSRADVNRMTLPELKSFRTSMEIVRNDSRALSAKLRAARRMAKKEDAPLLRKKIQDMEAISSQADRVIAAIDKYTASK